MNISPARRLQALALLAALLFHSLPPLAAGVPQLMNYQGRVTHKGQNLDGPCHFKFSLVDGGVDQSITAAATAEVNGDGRVREIHVTNSGSGYAGIPSVRVEGTGTNARAEAVMDGDRVASITVLDAGDGYSQVTPTTVTISPPPPNLVSNTFWSNDGTGINGSEPGASVELNVKKGLYSVMLGDGSVMQAIPASVFAHDDVRLRVWVNTERDGTGPYTLLTPDQRIAAVGYALMAEAVKPGSITLEMMSSNAIGMNQLTPEVRQALQSLQAWQATFAPLVSSSLTVSGAVDYPFTYQIAASGSPTSFAATGLPSGWTVNTATGLVSGIPATAGTITFNVSANNTAGNGAAKVVTVNVLGPVYVDYATGLDGNPGTSAAPLKTITQGLAVAAAGPFPRSVYVSGAAQPLTATLTLLGSARLKGGFDRAAGWTRTAPRTPLTFAPATTIPAAASRAAVSLTGLTTPVLVDGFAITSGGNAGAAGGSIVGVSVKDCAAVTLSNNTITAGSAAAGPAGPDGTPGTNGANGGNTNLVGDYGGFGAGQDPFGNVDGYGGKGGYGATYLNPQTHPAQVGYAGGSIGGVAGGASGTPGVDSAIKGGNGGDGGNGQSGAGGSNASASPATVALAEQFIPRAGNNGSFGLHGAGGAGGGGGGRLTTGNQASPANWGGAGGGGGSGASGGGGGQGGKGGGGSFSVVVVRSSVTVTGCQLVTGNGGAGGAGGNGVFGGGGGAGGNGYVHPNGDGGGNGGHGGDGGYGGPGGGGAGGNGGPSIAILAGTNSTVTQTGNTFTLGNAGAGGPGGHRAILPFTYGANGPAGLRQNTALNVTP